MKNFIQFCLSVPFMVVMCQFYFWIVSLHGVEKQNHCRALGIVYTTIGTIFFLFRTLPLALDGLIMFMLGLRLIAHGLDRIDKSVFIDRFDQGR